MRWAPRSPSPKRTWHRKRWVSQGLAHLTYLDIDLIKYIAHHWQMQSLSALAEPTRRRIVEMLAQGQLPAGDIAKRFDISPPAVSQHLQTLKRAGIVRARVDAQRRIYELDPKGFAELDQWLDNIKQFWRTRLDALERELLAAAEGDAPGGAIPRKGARDE